MSHHNTATPTAAARRKSISGVVSNTSRNGSKNTSKNATPSGSRSASTLTSPRLITHASSSATTFQHVPAGSSHATTAEAEAVFKEFTVLRRVLSDSAMDVSRTSQPSTSDYVEPIIPRSRLAQALARLRLHFSEAELSTEVALSSSKAGLNHDEFLFLVGSNINRRMSIEKVIKAFLLLQPSGTMGVDELKTFMMASSLHREGDHLRGEADAEPLTEEEFTMFCGLADPRGTRSVYIFTLLTCFYPKASHGLVETLLAKHGIGASIELRDERIRQEATDRTPIETAEQNERSQVMLEFATLVAQMEEAKEAQAKAAESERQQRVREQEQREAAAAHAQRSIAQKLAEAQQHESSSRRVVEDAERSERAALAQAAAKSKKDNTPLPPKPKAAVGCCRIVPDKQK